MAAKKTSDMIPLCHPLFITKVTIDFELDEENYMAVKINDTPEPEASSAQPEVPSVQSEAPSARPEASSVQPEVPSVPEGEALRVEEERSGVTPNQD